LVAPNKKDEEDLAGRGVYLSRKQSGRVRRLHMLLSAKKWSAATTHPPRMMFSALKSLPQLLSMGVVIIICIIS